MIRALPSLCLGLLAATVAWADSPMVAQPLAPAAQAGPGIAAAYKPAAKLRLPAPTLTVTRLVRQADGTLRLQCDQEPNPRAQVPLPPDRTATAKAPVQQ
ncbi:MAG: hypothetical protein JSS28_09975 [Proteobacteria bacterium]|nr:hypothetical protein [Pseudomonadota bacterium]